MRTLKRFTEEERLEFKKKRLEEKAELTLAYQLGFYVGEEIVHKYLPTLSVDGITTNNNISVTCGEGDECRRLNGVWFNVANGTDDSTADTSEWKALRAYHEMLEEKYLPKTVECHFQLLNIREEDIADFKKGIGSSLWECDCSHYLTEVENIDVRIDDDAWFTIITLKKG